MEQERDKAIRILLVGYGTLLSQASVAQTVGGDAQEKIFIPVTVRGFRRLFNLRPDHYEPSFHLSEEPIEVAAMNVMPAEGASLQWPGLPCIGPGVGGSG